jgi:hypothetical protein
LDLLRAGYIFLDHSASAVKVTDVVLDEMGDPLAPSPGWTLRLAPAAAPNSSAYDLLQDLVSGAVFPSVAGLSSQGDAAATSRQPIVVVRRVVAAAEGRPGEGAGPDEQDKQVI